MNGKRIACVQKQMNAPRGIAIACSALLVVWLALCSLIGVVAAESALHPVHRALSASDVSEANAIAVEHNATLSNIAIRAEDGTHLSGWRIEPSRWNGDAVLLLHGVSDNRAGMLGPANMLLQQGYEVLLPDARAHGASGGAIATYGVTERNDVRNWFDWLKRSQPTRCIDAIGDSMGAAQLLESLRVEEGYCAVVAESPFANFREAAYTRMGQQLGTGPWVGRTLLRPAVEIGLLYARLKYGVDLGRARPDDAVAASHVPVLLIHGLMDDNLPPHNSQLILMRNDGRNPNVALWEPPDAGHCGASSAEPREYESRVVAWFESHDRP